MDQRHEEAGAAGIRNGELVVANDLLLSGACVSLSWRGASALNIAQIRTPLRFFRVGPPNQYAESTQFGPITPK